MLGLYLPLSCLRASTCLGNVQNRLFTESEELKWRIYFHSRRANYSLREVSSIQRRSLPSRCDAGSYISGSPKVAMSCLLVGGRLN